MTMARVALICRCVSNDALQEDIVREMTSKVGQNSEAVEIHKIVSINLQPMHKFRIPCQGP